MVMERGKIWEAVKVIVYKILDIGYHSLNHQKDKCIRWWICSLTRWEEPLYTYTMYVYNHYDVHFKSLTILYVNYKSIKLKFKKQKHYSLLLCQLLNENRAMQNRHHSRACFVVACNHGTKFWWMGYKRKYIV